MTTFQGINEKQQSTHEPAIAQYKVTVISDIFTAKEMAERWNGLAVQKAILTLIDLSGNILEFDCENWELTEVEPLQE